MDQSNAAAVLLLSHVLRVPLCLSSDLSSACVSPAVSATVQLSQPAPADRMAEGEDQPPPGWSSSDPCGEAGTSPANH